MTLPSRPVQPPPPPPPLRLRLGLCRLPTMNRCPADDSFGPVLSNGPGCYSFDFTLVFEDYIFSIAPCGLALLLAAWRSYNIVGRKDIVQWPLIRALKLVSSSCRPRPDRVQFESGLVRYVWPALIHYSLASRYRLRYISSWSRYSGPVMEYGFTPRSPLALWPYSPSWYYSYFRTLSIAGPYARPA